MATTGKKFTSPNKWESAWFSKLPAGQKLLFCYLWDRCDHAGVIEFIPHLWSAHIGQEVTAEQLEKLMDAANEEKVRIQLFGDKVWLTQYIRFQQQPDRSKPINPKHPMISTIVKLLYEHDLWSNVNQRDELLFEAYKEKKGLTSTPKALLSLPQGRGVSLSGSKGSSSSDSDSKDTTPSSIKKGEDFSDVALIGSEDSK